jgi:hypothetical protein
MLSTDVCMYVCMYAWMSGCNEMYCDETTNATNISFGTNIPLDNRNRYAKRRQKVQPFWPPAAILNVCNFWTVWDIDSRPASFVQGGIAINSKYIMFVIKVKMAASRNLDFARISL